MAADERNRQVIAVDAASGEERWRADLPGGSVGQLVVVDAVDGLLRLDRTSFLGLTESALTVHDLRTLEPIGRVDLDDLGLADVGDVAAARTEAGTAVAWQGGAALVRDDGDVAGRTAVAGPTGRSVGVTIDGA